MFPARSTLFVAACIGSALLILSQSTNAQILHHYGLDGNAMDSIGTLHGTIVDPNGPNSSSSNSSGLFYVSDTPVVGSGYLRKFDAYGHAGEISLGSGITFADGEAWTVSYWSKRHSGDGNAAIINIGNHSNNREHLSFRRNFEGLQWRGDDDYLVSTDNASGGSGSGGSRSIGVWSNVTATSDGTNVSIYRDGTLVAFNKAPDAPSGQMPSSTGWTINSIGRGKSAGGQAGRADFDDVAIFGSALTGDQVNIMLDIIDEPGLGFDAGQFGLLYNQYLEFLADGEADSQEVGGLTWNAGNALGAVGISEEDGDFTIVFDDQGVGVTTAALAAVPEPASVAIWTLLGLGLAGFGFYRTRPSK